jgi:glycosyltransferase involved in cell wall biosynthesis
VRAARQLADSGLAFKLIILGEGEKRAEIEHEVRRLDLADRVFLAGFRHDVGSFLSLFDILVHPSRDEGLGTAILDGLAVGLPVVATNAGGIPEVLGQNEYGLVVPKQDPRALADGIHRLLGDAALRAKFKQRGPERTQAFTIDVMAQKTYALYRQLGTGV